MNDARVLAGLIPLVVLTAPVCHAETYLTEDQAKAVLFPGETFEDVSVILNDTEIQRIEHATGVQVRDNRLHAFQTSGGGWILFDKVIGKHDFIDIALGLQPDGSVKGVEIMTYRESHGSEVRNATWRQQFVGKTDHSALKLDDDIKNISGATLSSNHITQAVRRLLRTWAVALAG